MLLWLALLVPTCQAFSITHSYAARHAMMRHRMTENNGDNAGGADDDDSILLCPPIPTTPSSDSLATCVLAMGWFWGPQLQFSQLDGIVRTVVGYSGGSQENPCYHNILDSSEAILIEYDPQQLTYSDILNMVRSNKIWLVTFITIFEYHSHYICALQKTLKVGHQICLLSFETIQETVPPNLVYQFRTRKRPSKDQDSCLGANVSCLRKCGTNHHILSCRRTPSRLFHQESRQDCRIQSTEYDV